MAATKVPEHENASNSPSSRSSQLYTGGPPPYKDSVSDTWMMTGEDGQAASIRSVPNSEDGRPTSVSISQTSLHTTVTRKSIEPYNKDPSDFPPIYSPNDFAQIPQIISRAAIPSMNVVLQVVGPWSEVHPFLSLASYLQVHHGHRVRLVTHQQYQSRVETSGVEFFDITGQFGDPRNGPASGMQDSFVNKNLCSTRIEVSKILQACWRSCIEASRSGDSYSPFVADAIIAHPRSLAHIHCAERLGIPLQFMSSLPMTPTQGFPQSVADIQPDDAAFRPGNALSFGLVELMTWQGCGDIINRFRKESLGLEPINVMFASGLLHRMKIPTTYNWSPFLLPKPFDWNSHIAICGAIPEPPVEFTPSTELVSFIEAGDPPVYITLGDYLSQKNVDIKTALIGAIQQAGVRAIIARGQSGLDETFNRPLSGVLFVDEIPPSWILNYVSCVVHSGASDITSAALSFGKPAVTIPSNDEQTFWANAIAEKGAGALPIPFQNLTSNNLASSILYALLPDVQQAAEKISALMRQESGLTAAADWFHENLQFSSVQCDLLPNKAAVWVSKDRKRHISALAAAVLAQEDLLTFQDEYTLFKPLAYDTQCQPSDPISGLLAATADAMGAIVVGATDGPRAVVRQIQSSCQRKRTAHVHRPLSRMNRTPDMSPLAYQNRHHTSNPLENVALGTGKGIMRILGAGLKMPVTCTTGVAQGFHNIPKLYGDETVRKTDNITGLRTGFTAAGKSLAFNLYDGISGLVTHPYKGAQKEGGKGFWKGVGVGFGGVVCKPAAAALALPANIFMGIYKHLSDTSQSESVEQYLTAARLAQGGIEMCYITEDERVAIIRSWHGFGMGQTLQRPMPIDIFGYA